MPNVLLNGFDLSYDDVGTGRALVLLHGYPFNRSMWGEQIDFLKSRYRVIVPDLRGLGLSGLGSNTSSGMDEMGRDVIALLDHLNIDRAIIGGLSMGGYVTLALYKLFPLRVRAMILADTKAQADTDEIRTNRYQQEQRITDEGMNAVVDSMLEKFLAPATFEQNPDVVTFTRNMIVNTNPAGAVSALHGMATRRDYTYFLPQIFPPVLIVVGSEDKIAPLSDAKLMHHEIRGSRLVVIDGAGHISNLEAPDQFKIALENFLQTLEV